MTLRNHSSAGMARRRWGPRSSVGSTRPGDRRPSVAAPPSAREAETGRPLASAVPQPAGRPASRPRLDDDRGSQTAEYALVGGVAAAAAAAFIALITKGGFIKVIVSLIIKALTELIAKWF